MPFMHFWSISGVVELAALPEQGPGLPGGIEVTVAGYGKESQGKQPAIVFHH